MWRPQLNCFWPLCYLMSFPVQVQSGDCNLLGLQHRSRGLSRADHWLVQRVDGQSSCQQVGPHRTLPSHSFHSFSTLTFTVLTYFSSCVIWVSICKIFLTCQIQYLFILFKVFNMPSMPFGTSRPFPMLPPWFLTAVIVFNSLSSLSTFAVLMPTWGTQCTATQLQQEEWRSGILLGPCIRMLHSLLKLINSWVLCPAPDSLGCWTGQSHWHCAK